MTTDSIYTLYKALKDAGFPQGGTGSWMIHQAIEEKVYLPKPEELYTMFVGDPEQWHTLRDLLARAWIDHSKK